MNKMFVLENHRYTSYTYNYTEGDRVIRTYEWRPIRNGIVDKQSLPESHYLAFLQVSDDLRKGRLVLAEQKTKEDALELLNDDNYDEKVVTRDKAVEILSKDAKAMKKSLAEIADKSALKFIADVAKEENIDSVSKQKAIAEAIGRPVDAIFK